MIWFTRPTKKTGRPTRHGPPPHGGWWCCVSVVGLRVYRLLVDCESVRIWDVISAVGGHTCAGRNHTRHRRDGTSTRLSARERMGGESRGQLRAMDQTSTVSNQASKAHFRQPVLPARPNTAHGTLHTAPQGTVHSAQECMGNAFCPAFCQQTNNQNVHDTTTSHREQQRTGRVAQLNSTQVRSSQVHFLGDPFFLGDLFFLFLAASSRLASAAW